MSHDRRLPDAPSDRGDENGPRFNVPNALCAVRLAGAPVLLFLAWRDERMAFLILLVFLQLTDMVDGRIARWLGQLSTFGAKLDTVADVLLYTTLVPSFWMLAPDAIRSSWVLILAVGMSYAISVGVCVAKFRRMPSYHTRLAKISWGLIGIGAVVTLLDGPLWPLWTALAVITIANLEAASISLIVSEWQANVPSIFHALRSAPAGDRTDSD